MSENTVKSASAGAISGVKGIGPVGVVGLGLMGAACAARLAAAGFDVVGYDIDPEAAVRLGLPDERRAHSLAEIAARCEVCVIAVFNTAQVEAVLEGAQGLAASRDTGAERERVPLAVVCISTCDPEAIAALAARLPRE
ncbi:MAG: NAD(P)-dependent oxidoreductase, partial [Proteobacteria bacterium]|nr:NAD(P)-dependent oxidoreductase [Burkholderiales bacterium]